MYADDKSYPKIQQKLIHIIPIKKSKVEKLKTPF